MLSIIIVTYNVKYFTGQCLYAVQKAIAGTDAEVIVVDNNSSDGTVAYLKEHFPWVQLIANKENTGYSRANNQGWQRALGDTILFLNPDTLIPEDCLENSLALLRANEQAGALGIHMIDGTGRFLPESKRGFPSPMASFFKLSGLIKIFPHSRKIAAYYLGWLPEKENNEIEVLSGAYMMVKRFVLEKTGGFDEQFFMYGEDIDLSYRIRQAGYKNYYLGTGTIIHFKGESTQKDIRYTKLFYKAMDIFVQKHYGRKSAGFTLLMQVAIAVRGAFSFVSRIFISTKPARSAGNTIHTVLAGKPREIKAAAAILAGQPEKREITSTADITGIYTCIKTGKPAEVVFCAGALPYTAIIQCVEGLAGKEMRFRFSAAGSTSMVSSHSKNNQGEIMTLPEA